MRDGRRHGGPAQRRLSPGQGHGPSVHGRPRATRGLAIDLGSSRTRAWVPGQGLVPDPLTEDASGRPVRRGRITDRESCGRLLGRLMLGSVLRHPGAASAALPGRPR
ncbi:hypothetical protein [Streptomyces sp. NPDC058620]|uniref:hypothetical protein n=1 Tax=Streptomyces sp. NPDC058620 TaxID=3346560 RepID=UPI00365DA2E4